MSCDSYHEIGRAHVICQDYTLNGTFNGIEYIIISDGCSSAKHSEIGAQILCHTAKYQIESLCQSGIFNECTLKTLHSSLGNGIYKRADEIRKMYAITSEALEATLLISIWVNNCILYFCWGDGVIIVNSKINGKDIQTITKIDYSLNTPYYLMSNREMYLKNCINNGIIKPKCIHTITTFKEKKMVEDIPATIEFDFDTPYYKNLDLSLPKVGIGSTAKTSIVKWLKSITLCTGGISSYRNISKENILLDMIVPEIIGFKNTTGEFVKKRMFFLDKKARKNDWHHYDDIGCGTIYIQKK